MLKGFETYTHELTEYERTLLPFFISGFSNRIGKDKAITNKMIISSMTKRGHKLTDARVRKLINHIRVNGLVNGLIATSAGYYVSTNKEELLNYIESLRGRENEIRRVRQSIEMFLKSLLSIIVILLISSQCKSQVIFNCDQYEKRVLFLRPKVNCSWIAVKQFNGLVSWYFDSNGKVLKPGQITRFHLPGAGWIAAQANRDSLKIHSQTGKIYQ